MYNLDANHAEIKDAFLQLGCRVMDLALARHYTAGTLDLVVGIPNPNGRLGVNVLVEVKTETGSLRDTQRAVIEDWREANLPVEVVWSVDDVVEIFLKYREQVY